MKVVLAVEYHIIHVAVKVACILPSLRCLQIAPLMRVHIIRMSALTRIFSTREISDNIVTLYLILLQTSVQM
jgi:hypothetical protein